MDVTIKDLQQYRSLCQDINALQYQILDLAMPVRSPALDGMPHGSTPSDPTARSAERMIELTEELDQKTEVLIRKAQEIEAWIDTIDDHEIRAIIRYHFLAGKTWHETALAMYGSTVRWMQKERKNK